ncbi:DUF4097 domain-containing protein [Paenibacillus sp. N1-5-1-14]|uniref:DUF4097 domain-containing protein n=1 Tax=Paenibacillus radicibacter TaxID=2972488 RepID=UPI0021594ABD|nr:DUF4097 domain-containing protein [Paenibacillus radicibacter]MCR8641338.1 DUF4097 domain-containing protein [Paenibacillus radicibacter]
MMKKLVWTAIWMIVVGVVGMLFYGFQFDEEEPAVPYELKWAFNADELDQLVINSNYGSVIQFTKSTDGTNHIEIKGNAPSKAINQIKSSTISNKKLEINSKVEKNIGLLHVQLTETSLHHQITVSLSDKAKIDNLKVSADNGNVVLNNVTVRNAEIHTALGGVTLSNLTTNTVRAETDMGMITGSKINGRLYAITGSGNVDIDHMSGDSIILTKSGEVNLFQDYVASAQIGTSVGNVTISLPSRYSGRFDLKTNLGQIKEPKTTGESDQLIKVVSDVGNITVIQR